MRSGLAAWKEGKFADALVLFGATGDLAGELILDYDGTLTPIVDRPEDARLGGDAADELIALAEVCTVGIISGRDLADLADVTELVGLDGLWLAGTAVALACAPTTVWTTRPRSSNCSAGYVRRWSDDERVDVDVRGLRAGRGTPA